MTELRGISPNRRLQVDRGNGLSHGSSEEMLSKKYKNSVTSRGRSQVRSYSNDHMKGKEKKEEEEGNHEYAERS